MRFATLNQLRPLLVRRHPEIIDLLNTIHFDFLQAESATNPELLSPLMSLIYRHRTDLQRQFDLSTQKGRKELWMWWKDHGQAHYFGQKFKPDSPEIQDNPSKNMPPAAATNNTNTCVAAGPDSHTGNGDISLIGYPRGEFGLGEDIRLLRQSLKAVDVEPTVVKAPWHITAREMIDEQSVEADAAIFDGEVMFYVMPAFDLLTLVTGSVCTPSTPIAKSVSVNGNWSNFRKSPRWHSNWLMRYGATPNIRRRLFATPPTNGYQSASACPGA